MSQVCQKDSSATAEDVSSQAVRSQLARILISPEFTATESQRNFLSFVVQQTLDGHSDEIKGFTVATRVFGRGNDFDQAIDPIVSIQANKLRRALERYYLVDGQTDPVLIDIPKGTYIPVFSPRQEDISFPKRTEAVDTGAWPTILIHPFVNLTGDKKLDWLGPGFASELRMELTRHQDLQVLKGIPAGGGYRAADSLARFVLDGEILNGTAGLEVIVTLTDARTNLQLWSNRLDCGADPAQLINFQKKIVQTVTAQIGCEQGVIAKKIFTESSGKAPEKLKTYEAILRFLEFSQSRTEYHFVQALNALQHARDIEPRCSKVWSMLARLYIIIYSYEISGFAIREAREKAIAYAEQGAKLAPDSQYARIVLALVRVVTDEITAARKEVQLACALNPNSIIQADAIGYVMALSGDWQQGSELIRKAIRRNPYYPDYVHYALWGNWIRQNNYEQAYQETMHLRGPQVFWEPLVKAVALGNLGRLEEGRDCVADLLRLKPDFPERGRILLGRYIKFDSITEPAVNGLKKCGLELE